MMHTGTSYNMKFDGLFVEHFLTRFLDSRLKMEMFMNEKANVVAELGAEKCLFYVISACILAL
jgi:hypothetical protein